MLNFLDSVKDDVFIINSVRGMREANNKLYTAVFEDPNNEIIPVTHVSKNKNYLIALSVISDDLYAAIAIAVAILILTLLRAKSKSSWIIIILLNGIL